MRRVRPRVLHAAGAIGHWKAWGHRLRVIAGLQEGIAADAAILHVDCSVVPAEYLDFAAGFAIVVNGAQHDNRKRTVSRNLVKAGDDWRGAVIVKSDRNFCGIPEWRQNELAARRGRALPHRAAPVRKEYRIYPSPDRVPEAVWGRSDLVVERFLPEQDERGYWLRNWVFFGDRERCNRNCGPNPIVKGPDVFLREPVAVPEELRAERERLGFDYGKFDFVVHDGRVILLDANRTPGTAPNLAGEFARGAGDLAQGIDLFLKSAAARTSRPRHSAGA